MIFQNYAALNEFYKNAEEKGFSVSDYVILKPSKEQIDIWVKKGSIKIEDEINCIFDIQEKAMALLVERFAKKHPQPSPIKIITDNTDVLSLIEQELINFKKQTPGSKLTLLVRYYNHWSTIHCEIGENATHIAVMDPLSFTCANINIMEEVFEKNNDLKENLYLYKPFQNVQFDDTNCGIFALKFAQKMAVETSFFENLQSGEFILSKEEVKKHLTRNNLLDFFNKQEDSTNKYFILPPQYYSLHQRSQYLEYYKKDFGARKGVTLFSHKAKSDQIMTFEEHFSRKDRLQSLSKFEKSYYKKWSVTKHDTLHFAKKYYEGTIKDVLTTEPNETINQIQNKYILTI